jgi:hypothetical protein
MLLRFLGLRPHGLLSQVSLITTDRPRLSFQWKIFQGISISLFEAKPQGSRMSSQDLKTGLVLRRAHQPVIAPKLPDIPSPAPVPLAGTVLDELRRRRR